ncbi:ATP-dependent DNA ligase [Streptomyces olivochromogenes]|uniref:DNA ligase n=1 Tax=Streptomyces olivochromogenes TaxID=1963 RepID=A0A286PGP9_STROL|nr:DNA ligase [Streptomyces olivochromogenes]KUN33480.1 DNA ligase [Streptomyces olivochromogenes]GAX58728.1 DNA ligase [Streptomyces olivochromogenes]
MNRPVSVALSQSVPELPTGTDWSYEVKLDGHRMIMWRTDDGVRLQARSGRDVTAAWGDLALASHHLPAGTVLDGEAVITTENGRISFEAAQARAASSPTRAHRLATQRPAHYIAFDALQLPSGDVRPRPYSERRAALLNLLAELPANTPIQAVSATTDHDTALTWHTTLHSQGVEGIVAKRATSPYRAGHTGAWQKIRHAETAKATVAGYTGTARQPQALAVRLPNGRIALSQRLTTPLATRIAPHLVPQPERAYTQGGDAYTPVSAEIIVEVVAGTTRHAVVTVVRLR